MPFVRADLPSSQLDRVSEDGTFAWNVVLSNDFPYFSWLSWFTIFSVCILRDIEREIRAQQ